MNSWSLIHLIFSRAVMPIDKRCGSCDSCPCHISHTRSMFWWTFSQFYLWRSLSHFYTIPQATSRLDQARLKFFFIRRFRLRRGATRRGLVSAFIAWTSRFATSLGDCLTGQREARTRRTQARSARTDASRGFTPQCCQWILAFWVLGQGSATPLLAQRVALFEPPGVGDMPNCRFHETDLCWRYSGSRKER